MVRLPPRLTRMDTLLPVATLFRSPSGGAELSMTSPALEAGGGGLGSSPWAACIFQAIARPASSATTAPASANTILWSLKSMALARSEEHTSELQSLMRISYAVFCLKKKKHKKKK